MICNNYNNQLSILLNNYPGFHFKISFWDFIILTISLLFLFDIRDRVITVSLIMPFKVAMDILSPLRTLPHVTFLFVVILKLGIKALRHLEPVWPSRCSHIKLLPISHPCYEWSVNFLLINRKAYRHFIALHNIRKIACWYCNWVHFEQPWYVLEK